jgi:hypothetical protein
MSPTFHSPAAIIGTDVRPQNSSAEGTPTPVEAFRLSLYDQDFTLDLNPYDAHPRDF